MIKGLDRSDLYSCGYQCLEVFGWINIVSEIKRRNLPRETRLGEREANCICIFEANWVDINKNRVGAQIRGSKSS